MRSRRSSVLVIAASALAIAFGGFTAALAQPCVVPDDGTGTVSLPPVGCAYLSPSDVHMIINGLPPGTTIRLAPIHQDFICRSGNPGSSHCGVPDGTGGETEQFSSNVHFQAQGTGMLSGFNRTLNIMVPLTITRTGPRMPGQPVQSFPTEMMAMQGQLPTGDPDFDLLKIKAGTGFGMPSPGHTTLTRMGPPGSPFAVDSFFDVFYEIEFQGAPGGPLAGRMGSTTATIRMSLPPSAGIPTLSEWGMIFAVFALMTAATLYIARKRGTFARTAS